MIRKLLILTLCLSICNCGGMTYVAGLKFKKSVGAETNTGNASYTDDVVKLTDTKFIGFKKPMGECGAGVGFFGILIPFIPVRFTLNNCEKSFFIGTEGQEIMNLKLKYNDDIYNPISVESITKDGYRKKYKFKIDNFWKFRMADDKVIIVSSKTKDRKEFTEELPVKWGIMRYYNWSFP